MVFDVVRLRPSLAAAVRRGSCGNHRFPAPPTGGHRLGRAKPGQDGTDVDREATKTRPVVGYPSRAAPGGVAERSNAAVSKTVTGGSVGRGFKSLPLRSSLDHALRARSR